MSDPSLIRAAADRNVRLLSKRPERGRLTGVTKARIVDGLRCEIADGPWTFATDMPKAVGGEESAPTPGTLGRGALASCMAVTIVAWAARLDVPVDAVEVAVEGDFDARGELGMDEAIPAGYTEVRYIVSLESPAPRADIDAVLTAAERTSPYIDVFGRALRLRRELRLNGAEA